MVLRAFGAPLCMYARYHLPPTASSQTVVHHGVWWCTPCHQRIERDRRLRCQRTRRLGIDVRMTLSDDSDGKHLADFEDNRDGSGGGISGSRRHTGPTWPVPIRQMVVRGNPG